MNKNEFIEQFKIGAIDAYILIISECDRPTSKSDVVFTKIDEVKIALSAWMKKKDAEKFIKENFKNDKRWKLYKISFQEIQHFINGLDESYRKNILFNLF